MPPDFKIVIKEHPNSIGDRSFLYYQKLTQFNNTILINDKSKFENLFSNAMATYSVASTASMQSALLNVPSYTFVKCFFNEIKFSHRISLEDIKNFKNIFDLNEYFNKKNETKKTIQESDFIKNSFEGKIIGNEKFENNNLNEVSNAFIETTIENEVLQ